MRIALISHYLPSHLHGGVPGQVHLLANGLVARGHRVDVHSLYGAPAGARYRVVRVPLLPPFDLATRLWNGLGTHFFPVALRRIDFAEYEVVHAHGDSHFLSGRGRIERRTVRTFHSAGVHMAWRLARGGRLVSACGLASVYPFELLSGLRAARRVAVAENLRRFFPFRDLEIVPNALNPVFAALAAPVPRSPNPSVLFVAGSMGGTKRGALLLRAFERDVRAVFPEAELWAVCRERPRGEGVRAFGPVPQEKLVDLYRRAWVLCHPSSYETFGLPYLEAMACGTPVVATPTEGAREVLGENGGGLVVGPRELGAALVRLLADADLRQRLGARGLERSNGYTLESVLDRYEAIYEEVAA